MRRRPFLSPGAPVPVFPRPDHERLEAIRGLVAAGLLKASESPGTYARLAADERSAALNARGYVAYYEVQLAEADLERRRTELRRWLGEQRARIAFHAEKYLAWKRAERRANARVDELLAASKPAVGLSTDVPPTSARPAVDFGAEGAGGLR